MDLKLILKISEYIAIIFIRCWQIGFILCKIININQDDDLKNPHSFFTPENFTQKYSEPFLISSQKAKHCRLKKTNIMVVNQSHLEKIFELELMFNTYKSISENPHISKEHKEFSYKCFKELEPSIENYLKQMRSFRHPQAV